MKQTYSDNTFLTIHDLKEFLIYLTDCDEFNDIFIKMNGQLIVKVKSIGVHYYKTDDPKKNIFVLTVE